jgi:hypothetical protein
LDTSYPKSSPLRCRTVSNCDDGQDLEKIK